MPDKASHARGGQPPLHSSIAFSSTCNCQMRGPWPSTVAQWPFACNVQMQHPWWPATSNRTCNEAGSKHCRVASMPTHAPITCAQILTMLLHHAPRKIPNPYAVHHRLVSNAHAQLGRTICTCLQQATSALLGPGPGRGAIKPCAPMLMTMRSHA